MRTAFVLSGGASLGAVQAGMLQALVEADISPDILIGTSAGALNAAYIAGRSFDAASVGELVNIWSNLKSRDIFPIDPRRVLAALVGRAESIVANKGLRALLQRHLTFTNLEDANITCIVVATDFMTGSEEAMSTGDATNAVLASSAIPTVFPAVKRDGKTLVDGALANNTALSQAIAAGAERIYVLPSGYACDLVSPPRTPWGAAAQTMTIMIHQRLLGELRAYSAPAELIVLPPPCPIDVSPANFSQGAQLADQAYRTTVRALARPPAPAADQAAGIDFHIHRH